MFEFTPTFFDSTPLWALIMAWSLVGMTLLIPLIVVVLHFFRQQKKKMHVYDDLPDCPFCGSHDLELTDLWSEEYEGEAVCCLGCHAQVPLEAWKQRINGGIQ